MKDIIIKVTKGNENSNINININRLGTIVELFFRLYYNDT